MQINKKLAISFILLIINTSASAAFPDEISKLKLGMSFSDAAKEYPSLTKTEEECGLSTAFMSVQKANNIAEQEAFLAITFYHDKIVEINYNKNLLSEIEKSVVIEQIKRKYGSPITEDDKKLYYSENKKYNYVEIIGYDKQKDTQFIIVIDDENSFKDYEDNKRQCLINGVSIPN